jgi:hypothetical protein
VDEIGKDEHHRRDVGRDDRELASVLGGEHAHAGLLGQPPGYVYRGACLGD